MRSAYITGLEGNELQHGERVLLAATRPAGIILFARNCDSADQIKRLVEDAKAAIGSNEVLVLIDQEVRSGSKENVSPGSQVNLKRIEVLP